MKNNECDGIGIRKKGNKTDMGYFENGVLKDGFLKEEREWTI